MLKIRLNVVLWRMLLWWLLLLMLLKLLMLPRFLRTLTG